MDIMMPNVREQPAPAPWLLHRDKISVPRLICELTGPGFWPRALQVQFGACGRWHFSFYPARTAKQ